MKVGNNKIIRKIWLEMPNFLTEIRVKIGVTVTKKGLMKINPFLMYIVALQPQLKYQNSLDKYSLRGYSSH